MWSNDEPLQPFTINTALPQIRAAAARRPRREAHVFSTNLNLVVAPRRRTGGSARAFRNYTYDNHMPATTITDYRHYDTSVERRRPAGRSLYAHSRTNFDADATWTG